MGLDSWAQIALTAGIPDDAEPLVLKNDYVVARSISRRLVFRIGQIGAQRFDLNPSDIGHAHRIAVDMAMNGLNVLAPTTREPEIRGPYLVSTSPLATPLLDAVWTMDEATELGREFRAWSAYRSPLLNRLDIPDYVQTRARNAVQSGDEVAAAGEWCLRALEALDSRNPFSELAASRPGAVHGDVHPGNLVRHGGRILLIDLDSVKTGPALFDMAVGLVYQRRYNPDYPGTLLTAGYLESNPVLSEDLIALQKWKELSSYSQLLLRWHQSPEVGTEFWRRTKSGWNDMWNNIVHTPVSGTSHQEKSVSSRRG